MAGIQWESLKVCLLNNQPLYVCPPPQFAINVSTDMRHHRVRLLFQDSPPRRGRRRVEHCGLQVVLDPVHSVRLMDWWHPQYPYSACT